MLDEAELEAWEAQMKDHFEAHGGLTAEWIIPSGTSTTASRTPTGLQTPPASEDLVSTQEPWTGPVTTGAFPSATELVDRLKRLENEQRRAGTQFQLRFDSELQKWRAVPDNDEESADAGTSEIPTSPLPDEQRQSLEASTEPSHLQESHTPSSTATTPEPSTSKRKRGPELSSSEPKKRKTSVQVVIERTPVPNTNSEITQAVSSPVAQPSGRLARDIGQNVRRKSKTSGRDRKKRTAIQQVQAKQSSQETSLESEGSERVSKRDTGKDKANEADEEDGPVSLRQVLEASTAIEHDLIPKSSHGPRVGKVSGVTRTKRKPAKDQNLYSPYARISRWAAKSAVKEVSLESHGELDGDPHASSSNARTKQNALEQQQLENVMMEDTSASIRKAHSKPLTSKKIQKKTSNLRPQSSGSRMTRSQTKKSFPFVELDDYGEEIPIQGPNFNTQQKNALKMQRVQERKKKKYWKRLHEDAVERHNMQQVWREWFTEQGADYEQR